uniref:Uncharacterized protein n=1 Tax=Oryctolagus cuniculus TaxID=9986 RepID=A0A5F9C1G8_RABIT
AASELGVWTDQNRCESTAFCPIHSSLASMVMCSSILSPPCRASKSLEVSTKSYMKAMGKPGCPWY